ncbi:regulatory protein SdiA [Citrobacter amalonaticus]|nr:regulatory protein SdiA [Citrobacter amalonaticus]
MQDLDFFTWRRTMLLRFHEMTCAEDVYSELQQQTLLLEFDYYALCVRHPVPFTRPKISFIPLIPMRGFRNIRRKTISRLILC